jgi:hypothetical protein
VVDQLRGIKLLSYTAAGTITAGVKATVTISDGTGNTLRVDARLAGEHGNAIYVETIRNTAGFGESPHFDLNIYVKDQLATAVAITSIANATDTFTKNAHGLRTGDGPYLLSNSGGGLPTGVTATTPYFIIATGVNTFKLALTRANAIAGTVVDITTDGTGTQSYTKMIAERFQRLSMVNGHKRWVERVVNTGGEGYRASEYVRVDDLDTTNAEQRPVNQNATAMTTGAGEVTVTGVRRGDHVAGVVNLSAPGTPSPNFDVTDKDKVVLTSGTFTTANTNVVGLLILPKPA